MQYPLTEALGLWLWCKALTRRPTVLLCLRSLVPDGATATKPGCNSAGHQQPWFCDPSFLLKEKPSQQRSLSPISLLFHTASQPNSVVCPARDKCRWIIGDVSLDHHNSICHYMTGAARKLPGPKDDPRSSSSRFRGCSSHIRRPGLAASQPRRREIPGYRNT